MIYIDPDNGNDTNPGTIDEPKANPPVFASGAKWLFARGSTWNVPMSANNPWLLRTPGGAEYAWNLSIGAYDRPGENGQPMPVLKGKSDFQHNLTFMDVDLEMVGVECQGGSGTTVRIISKFLPLNGLNIQNNKLLSFGGKGLSVFSYSGGRINEGVFYMNEAARDLSIPWEDAAAGDGFYFGAGVSNCLISDNLSKDSGHSSFALYADDEDEPSSHSNIFINNKATGHNSGHCRGISIGGLNTMVFNNRVENHVGEGMTVWDKLNGVGTVFENCSSDYGITASSNNGVEFAGGTCIGGKYPKIQVIARQGKTTRSSVFSGVKGLNEIIIEEQSGGTVNGYLFDGCELNGTVNLLGDELTVAEANDLPGFDLVEQ